MKMLRREFLRNSAAAAASVAAGVPVAADAQTATPEDMPDVKWS